MLRTRSSGIVTFGRFGIFNWSNSRDTLQQSLKIKQNFKFVGTSGRFIRNIIIVTMFSFTLFADTTRSEERRVGKECQ